MAGSAPARCTAPATSSRSRPAWLPPTANVSVDPITDVGRRAGCDYRCGDEAATRKQRARTAPLRLERQCWCRRRRDRFACLQLHELQLAPRATAGPIRLRCVACALAASCESGAAVTVETCNRLRTGIAGRSRLPPPLAGIGSRGGWCRQRVAGCSARTAVATPLSGVRGFRSVGSFGVVRRILVLWPEQVRAPSSAPSHSLG